MVNNSAECIRKVSNFTGVKSFNMIDKKDFDIDITKLYIENGASPKLQKLFQKIKELDKSDIEKHGKLFKHIVFTDMSSSQYGAKLIAGAFVANGMKMCLHPHGTSFALYDDNTLLETRSNNFAVLLSKLFYNRPMNSKIRKTILNKFNLRPDNIEGDLVRFIILDQGFKEGIDVYDVKYVHLFEPLTVNADEKQAIGRGTRFCGQKGLEFHPHMGWPLYVFKYDVTVPLNKQDKYTDNLFNLYLKHSDIDIRKNVFSADLESATIDAAVDKNLTATIHKFTIEKAQSGGTKRTGVPPKRFMNKKEMESYIRHFKQFEYPSVKLQNNCVNTNGGGANIVSFTQSQNFVRHYFQSSSAYKGLLLHHSVGTGKTCSAIATATTGFKDYTILWVTRHTLKNDIWKNMVDQVCHVGIQEQVKDGLSPSKISMKSKSKLVSDTWMNPISYKQFSNMLLRKNKIFYEMVIRNGEQDPLRNTLLIIDEAHKLYSPGVAASEKPNTKILEEMIQSSYNKSGKDSVRLLMMTATPYTEDGMEMIQLLNLLRDGDKFPKDFEQFSTKYLNDEGKFTKKGRKIFQDKIAGYISYLNRSQDARNFAYPIIENVYADMTFEKEKDKDNNTKKQSEKKLKDELSNLKKDQRTRKKEYNEQNTLYKKQCENEAKSEHTTKMKDIMKKKEKDLLLCHNLLHAKEKKGCRNIVSKMVKDMKVVLNDTKRQQLENCNKKNINGKEDIDNFAELIHQKTEELESIKNSKQSQRQNMKEIQKTIKDGRKTIVVKKAKLNSLKLKIKSKQRQANQIESPNRRKDMKTALKQDPLVNEIKALENDIAKLTKIVSKAVVEMKMTSFSNDPSKLKNISQEYALQKMCKIGK